VFVAIDAERCASVNASLSAPQDAPVPIINPDGSVADDEHRAATVRRRGPLSRAKTRLASRDTRPYRRVSRCYRPLMKTRTLVSRSTLMPAAGI